MVPELTLLEACRRPWSFGFGARQSPILVMDSASSDGASSSALVERIWRRRMHGILHQARDRTIGGIGLVEEASRRVTWREVREQFPTGCIGLVAERGYGNVGVSLLLKKCFSGETGPGAIALLDFSDGFAEACLTLAEQLDNVASAGGGGDGMAVSPGHGHRFEWPPMMIFLPEDDPWLGRCALACRRMRSVDISIHLEVMRAGLGGRSEAALDELVDELDRFFAEHLVPTFPILL